MFGVEHRKGDSVLQRETSMMAGLADLIAAASDRARPLGADNLKISNARGEVIGIYPLNSPAASRSF